MEKSGLVPNALLEEQRVSMSNATRLFEEAILPAKVQQGDNETFRRYYEMIDSDKQTPTAAMLTLLEETQQAAAVNPAQAPPPQVTPELLSLLGPAGARGPMPAGMAAQ